MLTHLGVILNKALAEEPTHRYPTARELAEDLRKLLPKPAPIAASSQFSWRWVLLGGGVLGLTLLAAGSEGGTVYLWDTSTNVLLAALKEHTGAVWTVAFTPNGQTLLTGSADGNIKVWDISP